MKIKTNMRAFKKILLVLASIFIGSLAVHLLDNDYKEGSRLTFIAAAYEHLQKDALPSCYESGYLKNYRLNF